MKGKVSEKGPGIGKLAETLGGLGHLTLGVQGELAMEPHPDSELMVGQVAAIHELGLAPGVPKRSWLASWIDKNQERMVREAKLVYQDIIAGKMSRKRGFEKLGYQWAKELRENLAGGGVNPPLRPSTVKIKGHTIPLFNTHAIHNAITYRVFLPQWKNVPGGSAGGLDALAKSKTLPPESEAVRGSPQPPDKAKVPGKRAVKFGPKERRSLRPKQGPKGPPMLGPIRRSKYAGMNENQYRAARGRKMFGPKRSKYEGMSAEEMKQARRRKRKMRPTRTRERVRADRQRRKSSWALKMLKKLAKQMLKPKPQYGGRNQGYGSSRSGYVRRR
jgi:hypothetical protein